MSRKSFLREVCSSACFIAATLMVSGCGSTEPAAKSFPSQNETNQAQRDSKAGKPKSRPRETSTGAPAAQQSPVTEKPAQPLAANSSPSPQPTKTTATSEPPDPARDEVYAAIDVALGRLELGDFRGFFEDFAPVGDLNVIREQGRFDEVVEAMKKNKAFLDFLKSRLKEARQVPPKFESETRAVLTIAPPAEPATSEPAPPKGLPDPVTTNVSLKGFGNDLKTVLTRSVQSLERGELREFVEHMFPAGELRRPDANERLDVVLQRLEANPSIVQQMIDDLKAVQGLTPTYEDGRKVAVFVVAGRRVKNRMLSYQVPDRTFKFQSVEGAWRLYDNTTDLRNQVVAISRMEPIESNIPARGNRQFGPPTVIMEKVDGNWRITDFGRR